MARNASVSVLHLLAAEGIQPAAHAFIQQWFVSSSTPNTVLSTGDRAGNWTESLTVTCGMGMTDNANKNIRQCRDLIRAVKKNKSKQEAA